VSSLSFARVANIAPLSGVVRTSKPAGRLTVTLTALKESASLRARAKAKKLTGLKLGVVVRKAKGKKTRARAAVTPKGPSRSGPAPSR
jgi:hypothetical protein